MGRIFYIMGKSASGKDHIYKELLQDKSLRLFPLVLYTTRPMRENEVNGREYWFADEDCLEQLRRAGKIIEERVYNTVYGPWKYFTADEGIDLDKQDYLGIGTPESYLMLWNPTGNWSWNDQRNDVVHSGLKYFPGNVGYIIEYEE